ncbi:MAG: tetratricopeptide repeat protein [Anaerolineae bacterium]
MGEHTPPTSEIEALKSAGVEAFRRGDWQTAENAFLGALTHYESVGDEAGQGEMRVNLGVLAIQRGDYAGAEGLLLEALATFRKLGRRSEEAQTLGNLGTLYERRGQAGQAAGYYRQAVTIFEELGERENAQATLAALTRLQVTHHRWLESLFTYERMLAAGQKLSFKQRMFRWLFRIMSRLMRL